MPTVKEVILFLLSHREGRSDSQLTDAMYGTFRKHQQVNGACRELEREGLIERRQTDGGIRNYLRIASKASRPSLTLVHSA